jgi:hypothetical protein
MDEKSLLPIQCYVCRNTFECRCVAEHEKKRKQRSCRKAAKLGTFPHSININGKYEHICSPECEMKMEIIDTNESKLDSAHRQSPDLTAIISERDLEYEKNNAGYDDQYPKESGGGIKCKNYEICKTILPLGWFECENCYLCANCDMMFGQAGRGELKFRDDITCLMCAKCKRGVPEPNCDHFICVDCFGRCLNGDESSKPTFPYPDIEDEYYNDQSNPKWDRDYPLIKSYNDDYNKWDDENENLKEFLSVYLRKCPVCGK